MMFDSFLCSGDDAARQCSGVSSETEAGLSVGTSIALAPECSLTFPWKCMC